MQSQGFAQAVLKSHVSNTWSTAWCAYPLILDSFIFYTLFTPFTIALVHVLPACIQLSFIELLLVFRVPLSCNRLSAAQTTMPTKNHSVSCTSYHLNDVQTIVRRSFTSFLLFVYEKKIAYDICRVWFTVTLFCRNTQFAILNLVTIRQLSVSIRGTSWP